MVHNDPHTPPHQMVRDFLAATLPFSELPGTVIDRLARACRIDFAPEGEVILTYGETIARVLTIVQTGGVKLFVPSAGQGDAIEEKLVDVRGPGAVIGGISLISGDPARLSATTVEDSFLFRMDKDAFLAAYDAHPALATYFMKTFSAHYLDKAFEQLRSGQQGATVCPPSGSSSHRADDTMARLFTATLGELVRREPVSAPASVSVREAARTMSEEGVGSLLLTGDTPEQDGPYVGILTDTDLRYKVVAAGLDYETPAREVMTSPVFTMQASDTAFDALVAMLSRQVHHIVVTGQKGEGAESSHHGHTGVIGTHDLLALQGQSPLAIHKELDRVYTVDEVARISARVPDVVGSLVREGGRASSVARLASVLNDAVLERLLVILQQELGPPPEPFCWIFMGSEGRREQTLRTDQDNGILYRDPDPALGPDAAKRTRDYFLRLGTATRDALVACGFPLCPGGIMASEERFNGPLSQWTAFFENAIAKPEPDSILSAGILFDLRAGFGHMELAEQLRDRVAHLAARNDVFLRHMAADAVRNGPPLTFFKNIMVERDGARTGTLDVKVRGTAPFVDFARVLGLAEGVDATGTLSRLAALQKRETIPNDLAEEVRQAYEFVLQVRLAHQLGQTARGEEPDNHVNPEALSQLQKKTLREAFLIIGRMQQFLKDKYRLEA